MGLSIMGKDVDFNRKVQNALGERAFPDVSSERSRSQSVGTAGRKNVRLSVKRFK